MREGDRLPGDQAEVVFTTEAVDWIADNIEHSQHDAFFDSVVALFAQPWGKHTLSNRTRTDRLAGLNTIETLGGGHRVVFRSSISPHGTGLIQILAIGPRAAGRIYDSVNALIASGKLTDDEAQSVWDMLALYDHVAEKHGLEVWDYQPEPAPPGLVKTVVASGVLPAGIAEVLSVDELNAAMEHGWDLQTGEVDPDRALAAALDRVAGSADPTRILHVREDTRCTAHMPISDKPCIRRRDHPGAHRSAW
ncbi:MAG: hypothetical protein Q4G40_07035 [Brachybacterium sp.]|nr:hypothetical protein [Brachybacterium sp.]